MSKRHSKKIVLQNVTTKFALGVKKEKETRWCRYKRAFSEKNKHEVHNKKGWWQTNIFDVILHITPLF